MKRIITISAFLLFNYLKVSAQWSIVGAAGFSNPYPDYIYTAVAPTGEPYIVYRDNSVISAARVKKFNGSNWVDVGSSISEGNVMGTTMAFDKNGTPYIAYTDWANNYKATVMKFDGTNWIAVGTAGFTPGAASFTSIAIDNNGIPYLAFRDQAGTNNYKASVMKFDGATWVYVGSPGFSALGNGAQGAGYTSLAIDKHNTLYIAYSDFSNGFKATVMKYDGTNWIYVGAGGFSAGQANNTSIVIDSDGLPYVAYADRANSGKATVMKFDGNGWQAVGQAGISPGAAEYTSLAINTENHLYLAFEDFGNNQKATVMTFDGNNWIALGSTGFSSGEVMYTSMAVDNTNGILYIAYEDGSTSAYKATVMKYELTTAAVTEDKNNSCQLNIFPNPGGNTININYMSYSQGEVTLNILNDVGKSVYFNRLQKTGSFGYQLNMSNFKKGIYFIEILQDNNRSVKKVVLQ
ncbi:MAG: ancA 3 [Bacteroidetes bacterium]|nr:ancA 3 [Bacteroidota bacterium]